MGVAGGAVWSVLALLAGALLTVWLEPLLVRRFSIEWGPASPGSPAQRPELERPDPWLYVAAPIVALLGVCWGMLVIPFSGSLIGSDLGIGLFYFLVVVDFVVLGVAIGGWGADTPDSVEACYRMVAQLVAYVVPLGLAVIGPIMMARSLSIVSIVEAQAKAGWPYVLVQPLGFALYLATALMQTYRAPFLEPFSDRIQHGMLHAYGGWMSVVWRFALAGLLFIVSAMGAALFLGGYAGPFLPAPLWMLIKTFCMMALLLWTGTRFRPRSTAEMLELAWKYLIPAGLLNVLVVGGLILLGVGQQPFGK